MVEIKKLNLSYYDEVILTDISIKIKKGECILLTGKSGSGKSSIINSINGLATRYNKARLEGEIIVDDKDIKKLEIYQISMLIATVFQNPKTYFFNVNTTLELIFYLENIGLDRKEMDKRLEEMLKIFPIKHLLNRDIFKLSGGEKQILCVAACFIAKVDIIVLDEPSSNLDSKNIDILAKMLKILKDRKLTLIIAEHRIYYLMDIVDRVILIDKGRVKNEYKIEEFRKFSHKKLQALGLRNKEKTRLKVPMIRYDGEIFIKNLEYRFEGLDKGLKLKNIHLRLGKIYGLIGDNGNGKSSLLKSLIGVYKKSVEEIYLDGKKLSKKERLKNSSLVMQDVNHQLFTDSLIEEIKLGEKDFNENRALEILQELGLDALMDKHPMSLSSGQKQRLAIGESLYKGAKFLFFDEPTSGMDYTNMLKISKLIKKCIKNDNIIIIVSHDTEFLNEVADYIFVL